MIFNTKWITVVCGAGLAFLMVTAISLFKSISNPLTNSKDAVLAQTDSQPGHKQWLVNTEFDVTVSVARNISGGGARTIYLLVGANDFTEDKLKRVFVGFAQNYTEPRRLSIHCVSDERVLEEILTRDNSTAVFTKKDRLPTGYFRAMYYRSDNDEETMIYSPDQSKPDMETVVLKKKSIRYGDDINVNLFIAIEEGDSKRARELLSQSPNLRIRNKDGDNPLMIAILSKSELIDELLERTVDVNHRNAEGWTALMYAAADADGKTILKLIAKGAKVDEKNQYGYTALMLGASRGNFEAVKVLLRNGADVNARESSGRTALVLIKGDLAGREQEDMARLLKRAGGRE
jgi:hypothetical protein